MNKQSKFEKLVMFLAENSECGNVELDEEITKFEDAIEESGYGEAYFGIAKSNWDSIEVIQSEHIPPAYQRNGVRYYAEYYDGMQAPFTVCKWCNEFEKLEELLKTTSDILYRKYQEVLRLESGVLELGGEIIKLTPGKTKSLDVFELNKDGNKFQEDFEEVIPFCRRENPLF